jgi:hypothetical protein
MASDNVEARLNSSLDSLIEQSKKAQKGFALGGRVILCKLPYTRKKVMPTKCQTIF